MDRKTQKLEHGDRERKQQETSGQTTDGQETESQTMESRNMSSQEIEQHLKSALDALTPDVFEKLDLSVPQLRPQADRGQEKIITLQRRIRGMAAVAAACLCLALSVSEPPDRFCNRNRCQSECRAFHQPQKPDLKGGASECRCQNDHGRYGPQRC